MLTSLLVGLSRVNVSDSFLMSDLTLILSVCVLSLLMRDLTAMLSVYVLSLLMRDLTLMFVYSAY